MVRSKHFYCVPWERCRTATLLSLRLVVNFVTSLHIYIIIRSYEQLSPLIRMIILHVGKDGVTILHMGKDGVTVFHMGKNGVTIPHMRKK